MARFTNSLGEPITDREGLQSLVKERFYHLGRIVDAAKAEQNAYRTELAGVDGNSKDYTPEYLSSLKDKAKSSHAAKSQALYADAQNQLAKLLGALTELHGPLDMADPALRTSLDSIAHFGPGLSYESKVKINAGFAGNQPALRLLQDAYKSAGVVGDGGLDKQIYNPETAVAELGKYAQAALVQDGYSPFRLGVEIGKVAKLENVDFKQGDPFPSMAGDEPAPVDLGRVSDAARSAAGLPPEEPKGPEAK